MFTGICALTECNSEKGIKDIFDVKDNVHGLIDIYKFWIEHYSKLLDTIND